VDTTPKNDFIQTVATGEAIFPEDKGGIGAWIWKYSHIAKIIKAVNRKNERS
jgi:hypothetical protein